MTEAAEEVLDAMTHLIMLHRVGPDGLCLGCEELWARFVWHTSCPLVIFAGQVIAAHGRTYHRTDLLVGASAGG
ncbi:hypothetical protein F4553_005175 [Allocatelliglobosispora scoriae]|uniref:Uncharacterized protein n=1 Tax=Allocatelliglobosispora scoriae TaxID=643052 RepID=A0A841BWB7_9ACTN|nr:hypothetical protein [Allocatelliglobosispora scoriae]MBB5871796.1 hypothetical protein [Allocatelliglobosispora scoriae]